MIQKINIENDIENDIENSPDDNLINLNIFKSYFKQNILNTIKRLIENEIFYGKIFIENNNAVLQVESTSAYTLTLILENATNVPTDYDYLYFSDKSLARIDDNLFCLMGEYEKWDSENTNNNIDDTFDDFSITFTNAQIDIKIFDATKQSLLSSPWHTLLSIASSILNKCQLPGNYLNKKEKTILPLLGEICQLSYWAYIPDEYKNLDFTLLKEYLDSFGYEKLIPRLDNIANNYNNHEKINSIKNKYIATLNKEEYEPLWRLIYHLVSDSQVEYVSENNFSSCNEELNIIRKKIQYYMNDQGYKGTYPDFAKHSSLNGIHLAKSYNKGFFVTPQKNMAYHIHCSEEIFSQNIFIQFAYGTEILRRNESPTDIFHCAFDSNGHSFFGTVSCEHFSSSNNKLVSKNESLFLNKLERRMQITIKKAEFKKLTKEEHIELADNFCLNIKLFFFMFFIVGGLFALFLTASFIVIPVLLSVLLGKTDNISSIIESSPLLMTFISSWIVYGLTMGIITLLLKRK